MVNRSNAESLPRIVTLERHVDLSDPEVRSIALDTIEGGGIVVLVVAL